MKITNLDKVKDVLLDFANKSTNVFVDDLANKREMLNKLKKIGDPTGIISEAIVFELLGKKRIPNLKNECLISKELKEIFNQSSKLLEKTTFGYPINLKTINKNNKVTVCLDFEYYTGNKYSEKVDFKVDIFRNLVEFNFLNIYGDLVWGFLNNEDVEYTDKLICETKEKLVDLLMNQFIVKLDEIQNKRSLEELMAFVNPGISDEEYIKAISDIDNFLQGSLSPNILVNEKVIINFLKTVIEKDSSNFITLKHIAARLLKVIKLPKIKRDMMDLVIKWYVNDEIKRGLFSPVDPENNKVVLSFNLELLSKLLRGYLNKEKAEKLGVLMAKEFNKNTSSSYFLTLKIEEEDAREIFSIDRGMRITQPDLLSILSENKFVANDFIKKFNEFSNKKAVFDSEDMKVIKIPENIDLSFYEKIIELSNNDKNFIISCTQDEKKIIKRSLERLVFVSYNGLTTEVVKKILGSVELDLLVFDI